MPAVRAVLGFRYLRVVEGRENIPDSPSIFMANHVHFFDSFLMALAYSEEKNNPMRLVAKKEYFEGDGLGDGKLGGALQFGIARTGQIPVDRDGTKSSLTTFNNRVYAALERGDSIGIHPEGTRVSDGRLHKFQKGAANIAIKAAVPMVPVAISYHETENTRRDVARVQFGKPVTPDEYAHGMYAALPRRAKVDMTTKLVEDRVAAMLGYDEVQRSENAARIRNVFHRQSDSK